MKIREITRAVREGEDGARVAADLRARLRFKTKPGEPGREQDIARMLDALDYAMKPVRSLIGRALWEPIPDEHENALRAVSKRLGYERKQLKKMRQRS